MALTPQASEQMAALVAHLTARRTDILHAWRQAVERDHELTTPTSLPRTQFNDHIPALLDALARKLRGGNGAEEAKAEAKRKDGSDGHGLQRWQQGYALREVAREWGHLQSQLGDEVDRFAAAHADLEPTVLLAAWREVAEFCADGVTDSTARYFDLQQAEAEGHVRELRQTLEQLRQLERERADLFRQAAHDLRGNFGAVRNVTAGLTRPDLPDAVRGKFTRLLERSVSSLHAVLEELMDLARLQAGHELREVRPFDAAAVLADLCETARPQADGRGLAFVADGPPALPVEGDAGKVCRIAQNLLLNAIKYTPTGGVTVGWGDSRDNDPRRWMFWVRDTGPGLHVGPSAPLAGALKEATTEAGEPDPTQAGGSPLAPPERSAVPVSASEPRGEGIGLSIVKRLCELLDATLELESTPGEGTTFRVFLPRSYTA